MKAAYCEIKRGRNCVTVNYYSERQYTAERACRKAQAARRRRMNRVQETVGAIIGMAGFLLLMAAGGAEEVPVVLVGGTVGLGLLWLGAWLGHAFYGQEEKAEWLHRMRERGEIE